MFMFHFALKNPFKRSRIEPRETDYIMYDRKITANKAVEVQFSRWEAYNIFEFVFDTIWFGEDHGGVGVSFEVLGYFFSAKIYDCRHWDYENHCWEKYEEAEK